MTIPIFTSSIGSRFAQILEDLRHRVLKFIARDRNGGPLIIAHATPPAVGALATRGKYPA